MRNQRRAVISPLNRQQGLTMISMAVVIVMVGFIGLIGLRLFPVYLDNLKISSHLNSLAEDLKTKNLSDREIMQGLSKRFSIDDVDSVTAENIFIERANGSINIAIEYEVRTSGVGNVDMVASFVEEVTVN